MTPFYKNQFFWISLGFSALVAWGFVIAQKTQNTESNLESTQTLQEKTTERIKVVGQNLIRTQFLRKVFTTETVSQQTRGLASVHDKEIVDFKVQMIEEGQSGRDPWGFPLSYKKEKNKLYIWSLGPNHKLDSSLEQIESSKTQGDDILVTLSI